MEEKKLLYILVLIISLQTNLYSNKAYATTNESNKEQLGNAGASYEQEADEILEKLKPDQVSYQKLVKDLMQKSLDNPQYKQLASEIVSNVQTKQQEHLKNYTKAPNSMKDEQSIVGDMLNESMQISNATCGHENKNKPGLSILVSFSMPESVLLKLDAQARKTGARLVIRGLVNNSFKDTISYIKKINDQGIIVDIDPKIFTEFNVALVPVFILKGASIDNKSVYDKLEGNVSLSYALKTFADSGDLKELANSYLSKLASGGENNSAKD